MVDSSCEKFFSWIVVFKRGGWWNVFGVLRIVDVPISCGDVFKGDGVFLCDVVFPLKGVPIKVIPLVDSVDVKEFYWLLSALVIEGVVSVLREYLSCSVYVCFKERVLFDLCWEVVKFSSCDNFGAFCYCSCDNYSRQFCFKWCLVTLRVRRKA